MNVRCSILDVRYSMFNVRCSSSMFGFSGVRMGLNGGITPKGGNAPGWTSQLDYSLFYSRLKRLIKNYLVTVKTSKFRSSVASTKALQLRSPRALMTLNY